MEVSNQKLKEYTLRLMKSRMRLLCDNGFYGLLLMHIKMNVSNEKETAWTDLNDNFYFNPNFLEQINTAELDYVLMHLLLHVVLKHLERRKGYEDTYYDQAADIVANSNILRSSGGDINSICLNNYGGIQPHQIPSGDDGWKYSVDEVYQMLKAVVMPSDVGQEPDGGAGSGGSGGNEKSDKEDKENGSDINDGDGDYGIDDNRNSNRSNSSSGQGSDSDNATGGHNRGKDSRRGKKSSLGGYEGWDSHCTACEADDLNSDLQNQIWQNRVMQAAFAMKKRNEAKMIGSMPAFAERYLEEMNKPQTDWRTVLNEFIQEEVNDYSFCPPDRRFDDGPFFLPDFNEKDEKVEKILFMIDTSGSMDDEEISLCYSEIKGAIDQFGGKLEGWLGFFDAVVVEPKPFADEDEFKSIRPEGGGGTRFDIIFDYVKENMSYEPPVSIVILTDGYADFPKEEAACDIPVLWIINNEDVTPPWGRVTRIKNKV